MAKKRSTTFGARLQELRAAAGLTQVQLAERAGMHVHGLTKLEHGSREPSWATVLDLAGALGVPVGAFAVEPVKRPSQGRGRPRKASASAEPADRPPQPRGRTREATNTEPARKPAKGKKGKGK